MTLAVLQCFVHVGSVDPLLDDSIGFLRMIKRANSKARIKIRFWPGVSHAYMHVMALLTEAKQACYLSQSFLAELLELDYRLPADIEASLLCTSEVPHPKARPRVSKL